MEKQLAGAPESLRSRIMAAVRESVSGAWYVGADDAPKGSPASVSPHSPLTTHLETLAEHLLAVARAGPPTRDTALSLLAADTLITLACELRAAEEAGHAAD